MREYDKPRSKAIIPLEIAEIELSKTGSFELKEVIYGKAKITTQPYYLQPLGFDGDFELVKREYELYFKFKVR